MTHPQTQDDEALVEVIKADILAADAVYAGLKTHFASEGVRLFVGPEPTSVEDHLVQAFARHRIAALTALRNHEGRK